MRFNRFFLLPRKSFAFKEAGIISFWGAVAFWGAMLLPVAKIQAQSIYSISRIPVSAEAEDAILAKEAALEQGRGLAFAKLINRLVLRDEQGRLPPISPDGIVPMIRHFSLAQERTTDQSYRALMSVHFYGDAIKTFLQQAGVFVTETASKPILVLALDRTSTPPLLWSDANLWRVQWMATDLNNTLRPVVMPLGDLEDISLVPLHEIYSVSPSLWKLASKYGADEILVAELLGPSSAQAFLYRRGNPEVSRKVAFTATDRRALIEGLHAPFLQEWILANRITDRGEKWLSVQVPITDINQWVNLQKSLQQTGLIQSIIVKSLRRNLASVEITHQGTQQQLAEALKQKGIQLRLNDLGEWSFQD